MFVLRYIVFTLIFSNLVFAAGPYWPQHMTLREHRSFADRHFDAARAEHNASLDIIRTIPGSMALSLHVDSLMATTDIAADSLVHACTVGSMWFVVYVRADTVCWRYLDLRAASKAEVRICASKDIRLLQRSGTGCSFVSADSVYVISLSSVGIVSVERHARSQRNIVYADTRDSVLLIASSLNAEVQTVERYQDGVWRTLGIIATQDGLLSHTRNAVYGVRLRNGHYVLNCLSLQSNQQALSSLDLPDDFYELHALDASSDTCILAFRNGIVRCTMQGILAAEHVSLNDLESPTSCRQNGQDINLSSDHQFYSFRLSYDRWFRLRAAIAMLQSYGPTVLLVLALLLATIRALRYRRQLRDVIELGTSGISFVVDKSMRLRRINAAARELFEMDASTPLRRVLRYYCNGDSQRIVESFVASAISVRGTQTQKLMFKSSRGDQEIIFTAQPLRSFTGGFDGLVVSGVDITEELERKRLVNWAQLAHDMQTNLSIIKLNAEQLEGAVQDADEQRRSRIRHQAGLLLQRVRDIVSIGRDEQLHLSELDLHSLFSEVVREFDDSSFEHVRFIIPQRAIIVKLDKAKMLRALRNVVENALRAIAQSDGSIEFVVHVSKAELSIGVRDSGRGMDEQTLANFFKPYFSNYRQYGGTGIGTMIMQRAIALHNGKIEVQTKLGEGTTILFHLPHNLYVRG